MDGAKFTPKVWKLPLAVLGRQYSDSTNISMQSPYHLVDHHSCERIWPTGCLSRAWTRGCRICSGRGPNRHCLGACLNTQLSIARHCPPERPLRIMHCKDQRTNTLTSLFTLRSSARTWSNPDIGARNMIASTEWPSERHRRCRVEDVPSSKKGTHVAERDCE